MMSATIEDPSLELLPPPKMRWTCIDCRGVFDGPCDRAPRAGCAHCGSRSVVDCNVEPTGLVVALRISFVVGRNLKSES